MYKFLYFASFLFCLLFPYGLYSQNNEEFILYIIDKETSEPIHDAVCNSYDENNRLVAYDFSDRQGFVKLKKANAKYLIISNMGYDKSKVDISSLYNDRKNTIKLAPKTTKLKEIVVKASPVVRQKDTIVYNVASFAGKEDRYIGDVLKKLPGVTVADNGAISYQGKSISKLYIEGQDLMDTRYSQMTNNFPVEAVSQVHLMENHQNIKVLKDKVFEERAALNIKLKKEYKANIFGYIDAGFGAKPWQWDAKAFATLVSNKIQTLSTLKTNNRGIDLSGEVGEHISLGNYDVYMLQPSFFVDFYSVSMPPFDKKRYMQNKAFTFGINNLFSVSENSNIKLNLNGYLDRIKARHDKFYLYGGNAPLSISQTNIADNKQQSYMAKISYEMNSNSVYFKDEFSAKLSDYKQFSTIKDNDIENTQEMLVHPRYLQNTLNATVGIGKRFLTLNSAIRYYDRKENLDNMISVNSNMILACYMHNLISTRNVLSTSLFDYDKLSSSISMSADFDGNKYKDIGNNVTTYTKNTLFSIKPSFSLKDNDYGRFMIYLPVVLNSQKLIQNTTVADMYVTLNPKISYNVDFLEKWRFSVMYNYIKENDWAENFYSPMTLIRSHRLQINSLSELFRKEKHLFNSSIFYQNPLNMVFASVEGFYSINKSGYYRDYDYKEDKTIVNILKGNNYIKSLYLISSIDKTFIDYGLSMKLGIDYNLNKLQMSQYGNIFVNNSNVVSVKASFELKKWDKIKVYYSSVSNFMWNRNKIKSGDMLKNFDNQIELFFYPIKDVLANLSYQNVVNQLSANNYKVSHFLDFKISYIVNKNFEIKGEINNIMNNNRHFVSSFDGINFYSSEMPLRSRELFISCKFNF